MYLFVGPHDEEVSQQRREPRCQTTLRHEAQLHLRQADDLVLTRPTRQVYTEALQPENRILSLVGQAQQKDQFLTLVVDEQRYNDVIPCSGSA